MEEGHDELLCTMLRDGLKPHIDIWICDNHEFVSASTNPPAILFFFHHHECAGVGTTFDRHLPPVRAGDHAGGSQQVAHMGHDRDGVRRGLRQIQQFFEAVGVAAIELVIRLSAGSCQIEVLVQKIQEGEDFAHSLAAEDAEVPGTEIAGVSDGSSGVFSQDFGSLAGAAKIGAENGVDAIHQADLLSSQSGLLETFSVQGDIEPATQSFVPAGHIQTGVAVANDEQFSHIASSPSRLWATLRPNLEIQVHTFAGSSIEHPKQLPARRGN